MRPNAPGIRFIAACHLTDGRYHLTRRAAPPGRKLIHQPETIAKLDKASQNLAALCAGAAAGPERAAACKRIDDLSMQLWGPFMQLDAAGTDTAKVDSLCDN